MLKMYVRRNKNSNIDEQFSVVLEGEGTISHELVESLDTIAFIVHIREPKYISVEKESDRIDLVRKLYNDNIILNNDNKVEYNYEEYEENKICYNTIDKELEGSNVFSLLINEVDVHKQSEILLSNAYEYEVKRRDGKVEFIING